MTRTALTLGALIGAAILQTMSPAANQAAELTEAEFARLHRELQPAADAPWLTIPWKIDLLDAQQTAVSQDKPIFIWAMDGHPLGCT